MAVLTNDERVRAATGQFETTAQAKRIYSQLIKEAKTEISSLRGENTAEARNRISALERTISLVEDAQSKLGTGKAIAGGFLTGVTEMFGLPFDIAAQLGPYKVSQTPTEMVKGGIVESMFGLPTRPTTEETAPYFGGARGLAQFPLRTVPGTLAQSAAYGAAGAADQTGVATSSLAVGQLVQGLYQAGRMGLSAKQQRDLVKNLPEDQVNAFSDFMLRGQAGSDPQIAALIQRLKSSPETAEMMNALEASAKQRALAGMAPESVPGEIASPIYKAIRQKISTLQYNITGQPIQDKFNRAKEVLGEAPSVPINNTISRMDNLISEFRNIGTDSATAAANSLERAKGRLMTEFNGQMVPMTTVEKLQGNLSSFGKATGEENVFKDVARSDQERIAAVVFGGLKEDLALGTKSANTDVRKASLYLEQARNGVQKGYETYNDFVAQGLPAQFRKMDLNQLDDVKLTDMFKGLSTAQRDRVLPILEAQAPEAVKRLQSRYYNDFIGSSTKQLADGSYGTDFKTLVDKYNKMDASDKELLAFSLGTNAKEFDSRMADASKFFKYNMKVGGMAPEGQLIPGQTERAGQAAVGAAFGYQAAKGVDIAMQIFNKMASELKDTDVLKILLTPEGKTFLNNAKLSPAGQKTLDSLSDLQMKDIVLPQSALNLKRGFEQMTFNPTATPMEMPEQQFNPVPLPEEQQQPKINPVPLPE